VASTFCGAGLFGAALRKVFSDLFAAALGRWLGSSFRSVSLLAAGLPVIRLRPYLPVAYLPVGVTSDRRQVLAAFRLLRLRERVRLGLSAEVQRRLKQQTSVFLGVCLDVTLTSLSTHGFSSRESSRCYQTFPRLSSSFHHVGTQIIDRLASGPRAGPANARAH